MFQKYSIIRSQLLNKAYIFPLNDWGKIDHYWYVNKIARIDEITTVSEQAADILKCVERQLADTAVFIKNITTHQKTKSVYEAYKKAKNKEQFRTAHESNLIFYEAAVSSQASPRSKPSMQSWQSRKKLYTLTTANSKSKSRNMIQRNET